MSDKKQYKLTFTISKELDEQIRKLPRDVNLSEKLRGALVLILYDILHAQTVPQIDQPKN